MGRRRTVGMSMSDTSGGVHAFGAICAALYHRSVTGRGQFIDLALADCILWQNEWASQYIFLSGGEQIPERYGNRRPILIPGNLFRGQDGWVAIVASTDPRLAESYIGDGSAAFGGGLSVRGQGGSDGEPG